MLEIILEVLSFIKNSVLKKFKSWKADDNSIKIDMLKLNDVVLEIFCYKEFGKLPKTAENVSTDLPIAGTKHFALGVKNIEEGKEFVLKNNICQEVDIKIGRLGKPYFFITDPDGIQVEIIEED